MKILYVIHDNKKGGAAISFLNMISIMKESHDVFVLTPHKDGYIPKELDKLNIPHDNAHYFWWMVQTPPSLIGAKVKFVVYRLLQILNQLESFRVGNKLKKQGFHIVHSNSSVINFGAMLSARWGVPHVWHIRELALDGLDYTPIFSTNYIYDFMNKHTDCFVAISKDIQMRYGQHVDSQKIVSVYNGIEGTMEYQKKSFPQKGNKIVFLNAGNYSREKGQLDVAYSVKQLLLEGITDFEVWMAGGGNFAPIVEYVEKEGLHKHIKILGQVDNMLELRKKSHVEIVATKYEAFGRVTVEAMKASNPVIGTNDGGTKELIKDGVTGYLFQYMDYIDLARIMKCFIKNTELIERMGKNAYAETKGRFTSQECAENVENQYIRIVKEL